MRFQCFLPLLDIADCSLVCRHYFMLRSSLFAYPYEDSTSTNTGDDKRLKKKEKMIVQKRRFGFRKRRIKSKKEKESIKRNSTESFEFKDNSRLCTGNERQYKAFIILSAEFTLTGSKYNETNKSHATIISGQLMSPKMAKMEV